MGRVTKNSQISVSSVITAWVRGHVFSGLKKISLLFCFVQKLVAAHFLSQ
jgi:hypothetical protein